MNNPISLELQAKIAAWRRKAVEGTLGIEEMKEAVIYLRAGRIAAATASTSKKKSVAPALDDMMIELEGL